MNMLFLLGLAFLLLPVPLSFFIPTSPQASPDPSQVRRARFAVVGFPLFVAVLQGAFYAYERYLFGEQPPGGGAASYGLFLWAVMSWFFLAVLAVELRRAKPNPFPGHSERSASLRVRHGSEWITKPTWWCLRIAWLVTAAVLLINDPVRLASLIVLLSAGGLLVAAPLLVRRSSMLPEPLLPESSEQLIRAYARRGLIRARMMFAVVVVTILSQTSMAAILGRELNMDLVYLWLVVTIVLLAVTSIFFMVLERTVGRRIRDLQRSAAGRGSSGFEDEALRNH